MATSKWHISPDGTPRKCNPAKTGVCAYGGETPHFSTEADARTAYESYQNNVFSPLKLAKNAMENDEMFTFGGVDFDSQVYVLEPGSFLSRDTVSVTSDGCNFTLKSHSSGFYWEKLKLTDSGWDGDGTYFNQSKSIQDSKDKLEEVLLENAKKEALKWNRNPNLTEKALWGHIHDQKARWDCIDYDGNLDSYKLLEKVQNFKSKSQGHHFGELEENLMKVNALKLNPLRRGHRIVSDQTEEMQMMLHLDALNLVKYDFTDGVMSFDRILKNEKELYSFLNLVKKQAVSKKQL